MASGLPIVGWRAGNLVNLAQDGQEGILVPPGDVAGLTEALRRLALDDAYRVRLGSSAHRRAQAFPTWDDTARLFFSNLKDVLDEED
jgi:glycosyltransferase involved in cell wall biosynthesis